MPRRIANFQTATGIVVQVDSIGSSHETVLKTRIEGGAAAGYGRSSRSRPACSPTRPKASSSTSPRSWTPPSSTADFPSTIGLTTDGDHIWSIPTKADVKSMIWYPVKAFAAAKGYAVPKTWDELVALADTIKASTASFPFCVSAGGPGTATGWELTDWVEEVLLDTYLHQVTPVRSTEAVRPGVPAELPTGGRPRPRGPSRTRPGPPPRARRASMPEIESSVKVTTTRCTLAPVSTITAA